VYAVETFVFAAQRVDGGWTLRCPALPDVEVTVASLTRAPDQARAAIVDATGASAEEIEVRVAPVLPARAAEHLENASSVADKISDLEQRLEQELAAAVQELQASDLSQREISVATGLPVYRVRYLLEVVVDDSAPLTTHALNVLRAQGALRPEL
jgi:hypothetical protein